MLYQPWEEEEEGFFFRGRSRCRGVEFFFVCFRGPGRGRAASIALSKSEIDRKTATPYLDVPRDRHPNPRAGEHRAGDGDLRRERRGEMEGGREWVREIGDSG